MTNDNSVSKIRIQASSPQTTCSLCAVPLLWFPLQQSFIPSRSSQPLTNPFCANRQPLPSCPVHNSAVIYVPSRYSLSAPVPSPLLFLCLVNLSPGETSPSAEAQGLVRVCSP